MSKSVVEEAKPGYPRLSVEARHRIGTLAIDVKFDLGDSWTVLFGPSGSGKSTMLRAVAGLIRPDAGRISWGLADKNISTYLPITVMDSSANLFVQAGNRAFPLAPQSPSLFPHWSVADNLTMRRKRSGRADLEEILKLFRLAHLRDKMPHELSGGEAQRVNLARAVAHARDGGLLLLDEPFTGMDIALRDEIIRDLRNWLAKRDICVLSVTHDVAEAFQLGAEVIKIADGKGIAQGPVEVVLAEERELLLRQVASRRLSATREKRIPPHSAQAPNATE